MTKLLTTGEMIDRLKVGEIAKKENSDMHVTRESASVFSYCSEDGDTSGFSIVGLNGVIPIEGAKWRILPNYVSIEEAMQALKGDQRVKWISPDGADVVVFYPGEYEDGDGLLADFSFSDLFEGKWTIEED